MSGETRVRAQPRDVWAELRAAMEELRESSRLLEEEIAKDDPPPRPKLTLIEGGKS